MKKNNVCPDCDSIEFISDLNQFEVYEFRDNDFMMTINHFIDEYTVRCRECAAEVDVEASTQNKRIILKKHEVRKLKPRLSVKGQ